MFQSFSKRALHPLSRIALFMALGLVVLLESHPAYLLMTFVSGLLLLLVHRQTAVLRQLLQWTGFFAFFVFVFNILFSQDGSTLLYAHELPVIGELRVTLENIFFSGAMTLKLTSFLLVCSLFGVFVSRDEAFDALTRVLPKSGLVVALAAMSVPNFMRKLSDISMALRLRGAPKVRSLVYFQTVYRTLLSTVLEESWNTAEALYARGYRSNRRTLYRVVEWTSEARALLVGSIFLGFGALVSPILGLSFVEYYPDTVIDGSTWGLTFAVSVQFGLLLFGILSLEKDQLFFLGSAESLKEAS